MPIGRLRLVSPRGSEATATLQRANWVVPRSVFDARLVEEAVRRGAELRRHAVRSLEQRSDRVVLDGEIEARCVVGADGANGVARRQLGVPRQDSTTIAVAVRGYVPWPAQQPEQVIVMDGRDWPAYAWRFDAGDGTSNVGLRDAAPTPAGDRSRQGRAARAARRAAPRGCRREQLRSHHLPLSTGRTVQPAGRVLLAGDAASLVNPLTGEGIFYALVSGRLAGAAAVTVPEPGTAYRRALSPSWGGTWRTPRCWRG